MNYLQHERREGMVVTASETIYARSVIRRLKEEIRQYPQNVLLLSPYLTSDTAELVIGSADPATAKVYTVFSAENFASGASSLRTLGRLLALGYNVFNLPKLHAKVVVAKNFASIGSQNLTRGGVTNFEASVILSDFHSVMLLRRKISVWAQKAELITPAMLNDIKVFLPALRRQHRNFAVQSDLANSHIREKERQRELEYQRDLKIKSAIRRKREQVQKAFQSPEVRLSSSIGAHLERKPIYDSFDDYWTLSRDRPDTSFLSWLNPTDGSPIALEKRDRYLMMNMENSALAWPALNKTQITHFATDVSMKEDAVEIGGRYYHLDIEFAESDEDLASWNVQFKLAPKNGQNAKTKLALKCFFSLVDLEIIERSVEVDERHDSQAGDDSLWPRLGLKEINEQLKAKLLTPFRYEFNRRGMYAPQFLGGSGKRFQLTLNSTAQGYFLTISVRR